MKQNEGRRQDQSTDHQGTLGKHTSIQGFCHNLHPGIVLRRGEGLAGKVLETDEPLIIDDYRHWEERATIYDDYSFAAIVGVPVRWGQAGAEEEFLGVLDVHAVPPRTFSPADAELLSLLATQAAIAIRNVQILQAEQEQRELAEALEEAAAAVSSTLDLDQVLDRILEQVERVVPGDVFNVMLVEENHARTVRLGHGDSGGYGNGYTEG